MEPGLCTFCDIIARRLPGRIHHEDDELVVFQNQLDWAPVMLLIAPKEHLTQTELWGSGPLMSRVGQLAVQIGQERCPSGFRVLSNFGRDAMQTQPHGHVHVIGGTHLGLYVRRPEFRR